MSRNAPFSFYEFFAGGGMARLGLGEDWRCLFANDFDAGKARAYRANFADAAEHFREGEVFDLSAADLPGRADLAWASSPCQDFSLAGARAGLSGGRSSAFFGFWRLMQALDDEARAPRLVVIENVTGILSANGGADFARVCEALAGRGYRFGALEIDAARLTPQSRARVFIVASREAPAILQGPSAFHSRGVRAAFEALPPALKPSWVWWRLAEPAPRNLSLADVLEPDAPVAWRTAEETTRLVSMMDARHAAKLSEALASGGRAVGAVFRRVRKGVQRAEIRFDGLAGCLRTPRGGSSRQMLAVVEGGVVRTRWLTPREGARLMGLPEHYVLPARVTAAFEVIGDGVAVPVVRLLAENLLQPLLVPGAITVAAE